MLLATLLASTVFTTVPAADDPPDVIRLIPVKAQALECVGADVALAGDCLIVGADAGAYVYRLDGSRWVEDAKLAPAAWDPKRTCRVSVATDGEYCLIGPSLCNHASDGSGVVFVFKQEAGNWVETAQIAPSNAARAAGQGGDVALDGDFCIIGLPADCSVAEDGGAAYVFRRQGEKWTQEAKLTQANAALGSQFGSSVAIAGDYCAVAGWMSERDFGAGVLPSVHLYRRGEAGWESIALPRPPETCKSMTFGGNRVAMDSDRLVVGGYRSQDRGGVVLVHRRHDREWRLEQVLHGDTHDAHCFGSTVAVSGNTIAVSAAMFTPVRGAVYIYRRADEDWRLVTRRSFDALGGLSGAPITVDGGYCVVGCEYGGREGERTGEAFVLSTSGRTESVGLPDEATIASMTLTEAQEAMGQVALATRVAQEAGDQELLGELKKKRDLILARLRELRKKGAKCPRRALW